MVWRRPGISPNAGHARRSVKAGLNVSNGLTSEASAFASETVESSVAIPFNTAEPSRASKKMPSTCGRFVVQEIDAPPGVIHDTALREEERTHCQEGKRSGIDSPGDLGRARVTQEGFA